MSACIVLRNQVSFQVKSIVTKFENLLKQVFKVLLILLCYVLLLIYIRYIWNEERRNYSKILLTFAYEINFEE